MRALGAAPNMGCQGFPRPGSSPGVPQCRWVKGVQPAEIVQICTIIGLAPGVGWLTPSHDAVESR